MPIYEYQCTECGFQLEVLQKINDDPLRDCPQCGKPAMKKMVSAAAFRLKGGGWYETDFKSGDKKKNVHAADDKPKADSKSADKPAAAGGSKSAAAGPTATKQPLDSKK
ncbi:MAG: zinc ribbon domain-containing protein [Gammaproteobacteria bacterium]|jgi:putative FmdB family regulatory protein